jgi:hypothetical protein
MPTPAQLQFTWDQRIPDQTAAVMYRHEVAQIMDLAAKGSTEAIRLLTLKEVEWRVACQRGPDPAHITDPEDYLRLLVANSKFFLIGKSKDSKVRFKRHVELLSTPPQAIEFLTQYANIKCAQRAEEQAEPDDDTDLEDELLPWEPVDQDRWSRGDRPLNGHPGVANTDLAAAFDQWIKEHPQADKRLAAVARTAITYLVQSGGE